MTYQVSKGDIIATRIVTTAQGKVFAGEGLPIGSEAGLPMAATLRMLSAAALGEIRKELRKPAKKRARAIPSSDETEITHMIPAI